jgi:hypothetical protein
MGVVDAIPMLVSVTMILIWLQIITKAPVKRAGFAYADRLLRCCDIVKASTRRAAKQQDKAA